jgi:Ca2+-dependent lipid-binding protein
LFDEAKEATKSLLKMDLAYFPIYPNVKLSASSGIVQLVIHSAKELSSKRIGSPYVVVTSGDSELCRTLAKKKTNTPTWEFKHQFYCSNIDEMLNFEVVDDGYSYGDVALNIQDSLKKEEWYLLTNGKLKLSLKFTPIDLSQSLTDQSLLLRNEPLGVLKVFVVEAKGVQNVELMGKSDPYCKVILNHNLIGVTAAVQNTLDPQWRSTFFGIPYDLDDQFSLDLYDYNETLKDKWLGKVSFPIGMLLHDLDINKSTYSIAEKSSDHFNLLETYKADGLTIKLKEGTESTVDMYSNLT